MAQGRWVGGWRRGNKEEGQQGRRVWKGATAGGEAIWKEAEEVSGLKEAVGVGGLEGGVFW